MGVGSGVGVVPLRVILPKYLAYLIVVAEWLRATLKFKKVTLECPEFRSHFGL